MNPDIEKIEHLLMAKSFNELSSAERELVLAHLSGASEYEHMRATISRVKTVFSAEAAGISPELDMKEAVLNRFEQNKPANTGILSKISSFFETLFPNPGVRFAGSIGLVLVLVITGIAFWPKEEVNVAYMKPIEVNEQRVKPKDSEIQQNQAEISTITPSKPDLILSEIAEEDILTDQTEAVSGAVAEDEALEKNYPAEVPAAASESVPVYRNDDGYYQYSNTRTADAEFKRNEVSDAVKVYDKKASPAGASKTKPANKEEVAAPAPGKVELGSGIAQESSMGELQRIPVWPGMENETSEAYRGTLRKLEQYFKEELVSNQNKGNASYIYLKLELNFNSKGEVIKAKAKSEYITSETLQKIEKKAMLLPAFRFTSQAGDISTSQVYLLRIM